MLKTPEPSASPAVDWPEDGEPPANTGPQAQNFVLTDQNGKNVILSDYLGKVVVLEWVNWQCPAVTRHHETENMQLTAEAYQPDDVVWLAINSTAGATREDNRRSAKQYGLSYPVLLDETGAVARQYGVQRTPTMVVIDPLGRIVYKGAFDNDPDGESKDAVVYYLEDALDALLANETIETKSSNPYGTPVNLSRSDLP